MYCSFSLFILDTGKTGTLANSEDPDEMPHKAAFHQGLHYLLRYKQFSGAEIHHFIEIVTCNPFKYKMDNAILIVSKQYQAFQL